METIFQVLVVTMIFTIFSSASATMNKNNILMIHSSYQMAIRLYINLLTDQMMHHMIEQIQPQYVQ